MTILEVDIPDRDIERLPRKARALFDLMAGAHPYAVTGWSMTLAAGSGRAQRKRELNDFLLKPLGLAIVGQQVGKSPDGSNLWVFWIGLTDALPLKPAKVVGEAY